MHRVFVYGTLKRGGPLHCYLRGERFIEGTETAKGFEIHSLGAYPGMVQKDGAGTVKGEVYEVSDECLSVLDSVEGYRSSDPGGSLFVRKRVALVGGKDAMAYLFRDPGALILRGSKPVESGDWGDYVHV